MPLPWSWGRRGIPHIEREQLESEQLKRGQARRRERPKAALANLMGLRGRAREQIERKVEKSEPLRSKQKEEERKKVQMEQSVTIRKRGHLNPQPSTDEGYVLNDRSDYSIERGGLDWRGTRQRHDLSTSFSSPWYSEDSFMPERLRSTSPYMTTFPNLPYRPAPRSPSVPLRWPRPPPRPVSDSNRIHPLRQRNLIYEDEERFSKIPIAYNPARSDINVNKASEDQTHPDHLDKRYFIDSVPITAPLEPEVVDDIFKSTEGISESHDGLTPAQKASASNTTLTTVLPLRHNEQQGPSRSDKQLSLYDKEDEKLMASSVSESDALSKELGELQRSAPSKWLRPVASDLHEIHEVKLGSVSSELPGRKSNDGANLEELKRTDSKNIERGEICSETAEVPQGASSHRSSMSSICSMCEQGGRQNVRLGAPHDSATSLSNRIKCTIEDVFGTLLAWWPLSPTWRSPPPGYSRVEGEYVSVRNIP